MFDVSLLFKIGAMGILLMVIEKILKGNGKEEIAVLANLAGIIIILITNLLLNFIKQKVGNNYAK